MATKSFTNTLTFTRTNASALLKALDNNRDPKRCEVANVKRITETDVIKKMFGSGK